MSDSSRLSDMSVNDRYCDELKNRASRHACRCLELAMEGTLVFNDFEDATIDLTSFDWREGSENRNWWWQLQQLPVFRWYVQSSQLWMPEGRQRDVHEFLVSVVRNWNSRANVRRSSSPLVWHDHGSAIRLKHLVDFYALHAARDDDADSKLLMHHLLVQHVKFLLNRKNYSQNTNHGFEQAETLYRCGIVFPNNKWMSFAGHIGQERLTKEIEFAFTSQGVHKENSPGYQRLMVSKLRALQALADHSKDETFTELDETIRAADRFLSALTLSDGSLPLIGDTRSTDINKQPAPHSAPPRTVKIGQIQLHDFSDSGYVIVDYVDTSSGLPGKVVLKCTHLSNYHRHDDDLSVYWQVGDQCLLGDGGLYSHNEQEFERVFVRSAHAHCVPFINGVLAERRRQKLHRLPTLSLLQDPLRVRGRTWAYSGWCVERTVYLEKLPGGVVTIDDVVSRIADRSACAVTNWLLPSAASVNIEPGRTQLSCGLKNGRSLLFRMDARDEGSGALYCIHGRGTELRDTGIRATGFGNWQPAVRICESWPVSKGTRTIIRLGDAA